MQAAPSLCGRPSRRAEDFGLIQKIPFSGQRSLQILEARLYF
jgi:hypothetical protein